MNGAGRHVHLEAGAEDFSDLGKRPPALAQGADQFGVRFQFAGGWSGLGRGEEGSDFMIEAHNLALPSTGERIRTLSERIRSHLSVFTNGYRTGSNRLK